MDKIKTEPSLSAEPAFIDNLVSRGGDFNDAVILNIEFYVTADAAVGTNSGYFSQLPLTPP